MIPAPGVSLSGQRVISQQWRAWLQLGCSGETSPLCVDTQSSLFATVLKVSAIRVALVLALRRVAAVAGLSKGARAHDAPLCGHRCCGQVRGPYPSGCSLLPMCSSLVRVSGLRGAYWPSNENEDGRPVALETTCWTNIEDTHHLDKREDTRHLDKQEDTRHLDKQEDTSHLEKQEDARHPNDSSPASYSSSRQTPALTTKVDNRVDNRQSRQPP